MSETLPLGEEDEQLDPPFEPQSQGAQVWSVFDSIPAGEDKKALYLVSDNMDADPSLVASSEEYDAGVERDKNVDVETELFKPD